MHFDALQAHAARSLHKADDTPGVRRTKKVNILATLPKLCHKAKLSCITLR
jgi:hypothetical protein